MPQKKPDFQFSIPSFEDWLNAASLELDGANPIDKLSISKGALTIKPYYAKSTTDQKADFALKPSTNPYYGARAWNNTPRISIVDEKKANEIALHYLNSGADGILFEPLKSNLRFDTLLNQIKPEYCTLSFLIRTDFSNNAFDFIKWWKHGGIVDSLTGNFFWEKFADVPETQSKNFYSLGVLISPEKNAEDEIAGALQKSVYLLDTFTKQGKQPNEVIDQLSFSISIGTDFFLEIAKLRSLRNLWYQVQGAYGIMEIKPIHIHASSTAWNTEAFNPHGNMIKSTTAAMAAILGGCDSLTIEAEDQENEMMNRVARNVSSILREESYLSKVADATAGSYYLDSLTDQLSEKAWQKFQTHMKL